VLVTLAAGLIVSFALYRSERRAHLESARAVARADAINRFLSDDLLGAMDPSGPGGAHNPTMREVLARTADTLDARLANEPETKASIDLALGNAYFGLTDYTEAEKYRRRAVAADRIRAAIYPDNDSLLLRLRDALSWCYVRLGRSDDAERVLRDLMTPAYPPKRVGPLFWAQARIDYGIALRSLGKERDAEGLMNTALSELRTSLGADHFFVAVVQNELGDLYVRQNRWSDAVQSLRDAYRILRQRTGEHGQATLVAAANLGIVQYRSGQFQDAAQTLTGIHEDLVRQLSAQSPQAQIVAFYLASALSSVGRYADASRLVTNLDAPDLASAEPREDWAPRLQALRGAILSGQGHKSEQDSVAHLP
jgi:tetratricopeptide (TPR) repeat protein